MSRIRNFYDEENKMRKQKILIYKSYLNKKFRLLN